MKIEVAESLFLSWLRHVRRCRLAQLNWKPSKTWESANQERVLHLFNSSRGFFAADHNIDLYGQNSSVSQLVQQAEIDALGICDLEERPAIIAVDVAFHEAGLNYGTKDKTVARVVKKILRTVLVIESYFADYSSEVIFATPKINQAVQTPLDTAMVAVEQFFEREGLSFECRVVANKDFFSKIIEPVSKLSSQVADTSELFMRSVQLLEMAPTAKHSQSLSTGQIESKTSEQKNEKRIGQLVQEKFQKLLEKNLLNDSEVAKLCTREYSKSAFGLRYPALKQSRNAQDRFDDGGHARYYSKIFGGEYLLCNDWYERNRNRFDQWLLGIEQGC